MVKVEKYPSSAVIMEIQKADIKEFEEIDNSDIVNNSLEFSLSNSSEETDYEAWSTGSKRFADDNYNTIKRWVN
jgi:predicted AAA+ superfamily ATPase